MYKIIAVLVMAAALAGCDLVSALKDGLKHAGAVETDLAEVTGVRPQVGFNWNNGRLTSVTVNFPRLYEEKPLRELAGLARAAIAKEFKETPKTILLSFTLDPATTAEATAATAAN
jgi:hypothetical protein